MSIYSANALGECMEATNICPFNKMATCFPKAIIICSVQKTVKCLDSGLHMYRLQKYICNRSTARRRSSHIFMEWNVYGMEWLQRDLAEFVIEHCFACPSRLF